MTRLWPLILVALFLLMIFWPLITKAEEQTHTIEVTATIDPVFQVEVNCFMYGTMDDPQCQHALAQLEAAGGSYTEAVEMYTHIEDGIVNY